MDFEYEVNEGGTKDGVTRFELLPRSVGGTVPDLLTTYDLVDRLSEVTGDSDRAHYFLNLYGSAVRGIEARYAIEHYAGPLNEDSPVYGMSLEDHFFVTESPQCWDLLGNQPSPDPEFAAFLQERCFEFLDAKYSDGSTETEADSGLLGVFWGCYALALKAHLINPHHTLDTFRQYLRDLENEKAHPARNDVYDFDGGLRPAYRHLTPENRQYLRSLLT